MNTKTDRISILSYFGGKSRILEFVLPTLDTPHSSYVEVFCGSAAVFLNKKKAPIETINDKDGRLVNFFRVLREYPDQLIAQIELTPYSRKEFITAATMSPDPIEDARRYFVRSLQSFAGHTDHENRGKSWRASITESRNAKSSAVQKWRRKAAGLDMAIERLLDAQIENRDFREVILRYDTKDTLFYCDPPYLHADRTGKKDYTHEMTMADHFDLSEMLNSAKGKVAVSGYDSGEMDQLYPPSKWMKHYGPARRSNLSKTTSKRECIWTNYAPMEGMTIQLFKQQTEPWEGENQEQHT